MTNGKKNSFILYASQYESVKDLTNDQKALLFDSLFQYVISSEIPQIKDGEVRMAFKFIKGQIDCDRERYENICEKRREYGRRGGKANASDVSKSKQKQAKGSKSKQVQASEADNDNDNDNDSQEPKGSMSEDSTLLTEGMSDSDAVPTQPKTFREKVIALFNVSVSGKSIKPIRSIKEGTQRAEWLKARRREYGDAAIEEMFMKAAASSFLNGNNRKGWTATFDWLIRPNNFPKVWEGNYDDEKINETTIEQQTDWQS